MNQRKFLPLIVFALCLGLFSCNMYKDVSLSNDVFLSHKIWKENYNRYVYLVHDDNSVYRLDNVSVVRDSASGNVETILGTTNSIVKDTTVTKSKRQIKKDEQKEVHLYLMKNDDRDIEDGGGVEIAQNDIQRAQMQGRKFKGLLGIILGAIGVVVGLFLLLVVILIFALLAESGGGGSNSNSDPQCYVATMVYGSTEAPEVLALRRFRDQCLKPNPMGRAFIKWYYKNSPDFVERHESNTTLNSVIRSILNLVVRIIR